MLSLCVVSLQRRLGIYLTSSQASNRMVFFPLLIKMANEAHKEDVVFRLSTLQGSINIQLVGNILLTTLPDGKNKIKSNWNGGLMPFLLGKRWSPKNFYFPIVSNCPIEVIPSQSELLANALYLSMLRPGQQKI